MCRCGNCPRDRIIYSIELIINRQQIFPINFLPSHSPLVTDGYLHNRPVPTSLTCEPTVLLPPYLFTSTRWDFHHSCNAFSFLHTIFIIGVTFFHSFINTFFNYSNCIPDQLTLSSCGTPRKKWNRKKDLVSYFVLPDETFSPCLVTFLGLPFRALLFPLLSVVSGPSPNHLAPMSLLSHLFLYTFCPHSFHCNT